MRREMRASYTVEASWVMSICMFIVFASLSISIAMYKGTYGFLNRTDVKEIETVTTFRRLAFGKEVLGIEQGGEDAD